VARNQSRLVEYAQYLGVRTVAGLISCFDVEQNLQTAATVGSIFFRASAKRRRRATGNIARSFPHWDADRVEAVAERSMQYMFQLFLVDTLLTPRLLTERSWPRHVRIGPVDPLLDRLILGEPVILVTGHCGNWELLGQILALLGYPLLALARPLDNRYLNRWLLGIRQTRGTKIITKWGATPVIEQTLREGGRIGFIADQNAGSQGLFVPFFGRLASSYKSIGLLAMRHRVPIAAGFACRLNGRFAYEISCTDFIEPSSWETQPDPLFYITARFNRAIERMVRSAPEQYLWLHRRWKSRPRHEQTGRPMPARLVAKLRSLPWMTDEQMERIVETSGVTEAVV
jgi:KDO2-lipid IV(A) lauroyltransferase